jgi:uncharacterized protein (UPF0333 family)
MLKLSLRTVLLLLVLLAALIVAIYFLVKHFTHHTLASVGVSTSNTGLHQLTRPSKH